MQPVASTSCGSRKSKRIWSVQGRILGLIGLGFLLPACASYTDETREVRRLIYRENFEAALEQIDKSALAKQERNMALYHMERGTILYLEGDFRNAAADWRKASEHLDKLYTISLSSAAAGLAINDSYADYEGELHERILLPVFSALAYLADNDLRAARVEARRLDEVMTALEGAGDDKPEYARDAFAHYLPALIYEALGETDSALIEYNRGLDNLSSASGWNASAIDDELFAEPLCRLAKLRNRSDLSSKARKILPKDCENPDPTQAQIIVIYENGRSPIKVAKDIVFPVQGQVVRISYPSYQESYYSSRGASVRLGGKVMGRTELLEDIGHLARQSLDARRTKDIIRMGARILAKDQAARATGRALGPLAGLAMSIAGAVTETADTRSWTSLPDEIQIFRTSLRTEGKTRSVVVEVRPDSGKPLRESVDLKPGSFHFLRVRSFD